MSATDVARTGWTVARASGGPLRAVAALLALARGGRRFMPEGCYSLHVVAAGRSAAAVTADLAAARRLATGHGGAEVAATVPRFARADLFPAVNALLDLDGGRWAALNAKVAHSDARALIEGHARLLAPHAAAMARHGVTVTRLASALGNHAFSFEPVFHWRDRWLPIHRQVPDPAYLRSLTEPAANPGARELVDQLRAETVAYFRSVGAASNQIGRAYPFLEALAPAPAALLRQIKASVDPAGLVNPGVLGLS